LDRKLTREALRIMESRRPFVRATVVKATGSVPGKVGATLLVREDGTTAGTVGGAALEEKVKELAAQALVTRRGDLHHFDLQKWREGGLPSLCGGAVEIAVEYVPARPNLLLWGGGHVAHALAQLLPTLEYDYSVADDRPDWVTEERFPTADRHIVSPAETLWDRADPQEYSHLYLLGYDALRDLELLHRTLPVFQGHIGMISSSSKRDHIFAELRRRGVDEASLGRVRAPIGLPIGAETPSEIAVSIVAEIVQTQHRPSPETPGTAVPTPDRARSGHAVGSA
jgi:xanthine dehydrogenase accessory factor